MQIEVSPITMSYICFNAAREGSPCHLWGSTTNHIKAIVHPDHAMIGQRHRQGRCTTPRPPLQGPTLHTVGDEKLALQLHQPTQQVHRVPE